MEKDFASVTFQSYETTVSECMAAGGAGDLLAADKPVMLKPNLINDSPHPVTTPPAFCAAVIAFVREHTQAPIVIAEGSGDAGLDTMEIFSRLGYDTLAREMDVTLLDLNTAPQVRLTGTVCRIFKEWWLPQAVFEQVLISMPVLKAHSLCRFSGTLKNMMGLASPQHHGGGSGGWKKEGFHPQLDGAIMELSLLRKPDFTVMDATIGLAESHLGGPHCDPPVNRILAGKDALAVDREAAGLLGIDWHDVGHLGSPQI